MVRQPNKSKSEWKAGRKNLPPTMEMRSYRINPKRQKYNRSNSNRNPKKHSRPTPQQPTPRLGMAGNVPQRKKPGPTTGKTIPQRRIRTIQTIRTCEHELIRHALDHRPRRGGPMWPPSPKNLRLNSLATCPTSNTISSCSENTIPTSIPAGQFAFPAMIILRRARISLQFAHKTIHASSAN